MITAMLLVLADVTELLSFLTVKQISA